MAAPWPEPVRRSSTSRAPAAVIRASIRRCRVPSRTATSIRSCWATYVFEHGTRARTGRSSSASRTGATPTATATLRAALVTERMADGDARERRRPAVAITRTITRGETGTTRPCLTGCTYVRAASSTRRSSWPGGSTCAYASERASCLVRESTCIRARRSWLSVPYLRSCRPELVLMRLPEAPRMQRLHGAAGGRNQKIRPQRIPRQFSATSWSRRVNGASGRLTARRTW